MALEGDGIPNLGASMKSLKLNGLNLGFKVLFQVASRFAVKPGDMISPFSVV